MGVPDWAGVKGEFALASSASSGRLVLLVATARCAPKICPGWCRWCRRNAKCCTHGSIRLGRSIVHVSWKFQTKLQTKWVYAADAVIKLGACNVATELEESYVLRPFVEIMHVNQANRVPFGIETTCRVKKRDIVDTSENVACNTSRLLVSSASIDWQFVGKERQNIRNTVSSIG